MVVFFCPFRRQKPWVLLRNCLKTLGSLVGPPPFSAEGTVGPPRKPWVLHHHKQGEPWALGKNRTVGPSPFHPSPTLTLLSTVHPIRHHRVVLPPVGPPPAGSTHRGPSSMASRGNRGSLADLSRTWSEVRSLRWRRVSFSEHGFVTMRGSGAPESRFRDEYGSRSYGTSQGTRG